MGNICCWKQDRRRGPCNEVRWLEFVMCVICVIFTIVASQLGYFKPSGFYIVFYFVPIMYLLVTFYDILVICTYYPIGWRAWILFAISATLMFVLCAGASPIILANWWFVYTILYIITAIIFMIDALCVVRLVALFAPKTQREMDDCCNPYCNTKFSQVVPAQEPVEHDYAQTREPYEFEDEEQPRHHNRRNPRHRHSETDYNQQDQQDTVYQKLELPHIISVPTTSYEIEFERQLQSYSTSFFIHMDKVNTNKHFARNNKERGQQEISLNHCAGDMFVPPGRTKNVIPISRIPTMRQVKPQDIDMTPLKSPFTKNERALIQFKQKDVDFSSKE